MSLQSISALLQGEVVSLEQRDPDFLSQTLASCLSQAPTNHHLFCQSLATYGPRQVCQYQFKTNDIVWVCKQCQKDDTCVLCNRCYQASDHTGHEVYFYHSAAGGCCDCGDADAWSPEGFCTMHGKRSDDPIRYLPTQLQLFAVEMFRLIFNCFEQFSEWYCKLQDFESTFDDGESYSLYLYMDDLHSITEISTMLNATSIHQLMGGLPEERSEQLLQQRGHLRIKSGLNGPTVNMLLQLLRTQKFTIRMLNGQQERCRDAILLALRWLREIVLSCDGLCSLACSVLHVDKLRTLMLYDMHLDKEIGNAFHNLLLSLMADQSFKMLSAVAYAFAYRKLCADFSRGIGIVGSTMYNLSVQFLNREYFVAEIVYHHSFPEQAVMALQDMLHVSFPADDGFAKSLCITKRRYTHVIGDLKIIFAIPEISRYFSGSCLEAWLSILEGCQQLNPQRRQFEAHVMYEDRNWMHAFNLTLGLCSLFDFLTNWFLDPASGIKILKTSSSETCSHNVEVSLIDVQQVISTITRKCFQWQSGRDNTYCDNAAAILDEGSTLSSWEVFQSPGQQILLRYFSLLFIRTESKSFHFPLHRFLAYNILESSKHPHLTSTLYSIGLLLAEESRQTLSMVFSVLQPILFGMEVKQGKWKRNGGCVYDQLMNYAEPPFARIFRDLDTTIVQLALVVLPTPLFFVYLFNEACIIKIMLQDSLELIGTSCPLEPEFSAGMIAEVLLFIINIITELPAPSNANVHERLCQQIKREWIHKLAAEPCTYSQLQDLLNSTNEHTKLSSIGLDQMLFDISNRTQVSTLSAPMYSLKRELWTEYDPSFPHLTESNHQAAADKKPKITEPQPLVRRCLPAHEYFEDIRLKLLFEPIILLTLRNLLHSAAWRHLRHEEYSRQRLLDVSFDCNDTIVHRIVHLLTLALHEAKALLEGSCNSEEHAMVTSFFSSLCFEAVATIDEEGENTVERLNPSSFRTLFRLKKRYEEVSEINIAYHIDWLLLQCSQLNPACKILLDELQPPTPIIAFSNDANAAVDFEQLKKQNANKALLSMQAAASSFLAGLGDLSDSEEEDDEEEDGGEGKLQTMDVETNAPNNVTSSLSNLREQADNEDKVCIICQTDMDISDEDNQEDYFGYLALVQYSNLGYVDKERGEMQVVDERPKVASDYKHKGKWNHSNCRIGFCGHMMHYFCFTAYCKNQNDTSTGQYHLIVDTSQGYVTCPLCRKLCNSLVPAMEKSKVSPVQVEDENFDYSPEESMKSLSEAIAAHRLPALDLFTAEDDEHIDRHNSSAINRFSTLFSDKFSSDTFEDYVIETLINTIAYTISLDLSEHIVPGYHIPVINSLMNEYKTYHAVEHLSYGKYSPGFDDLRNLSALFDVLGRNYLTSNHQEAYTFLEELVSKFTPCKPARHNTMTVCKAFCWLSKLEIPLLPLLCLPLVDVTIYLSSLCLIQTPTEPSKSLWNFLPWLAVAELAQICDKLDPPKVGSISYQRSAEWPSLSPLIEIMIEASILQSNPTPDVLRRIALEWVTFLRLILHIVTRMPYNPIKERYLKALNSAGDKAWALQPLSIDSMPDEMVGQYMSILGIDQLLASRQDVTVYARHWLQDYTVYHIIEIESDYVGRFKSYPHYKPFQLIPLPEDYSRLHAEVSSLCSFEQPALCLVCGSILNAGGQGQCFIHSLECCEGTGAFLMTQDCNIVLTFGPRSAYFPSVYLDIYGDIHKSYRGKPLRLNKERYEALRSLWASHGIASDVVAKRSSGTRVIIMGYY